MELIKKFKLKQRFPNFFSGFIPKEYDFDTIEELLDIPFVKRWMEMPKFFRLTKSRMKSSQQILMCELNEGKEFWAIGWLYNSYDLDLPVRKDFSRSKE